ncbi:hypothetical protein L1987_47749 [Smallanthus sonchifolius]|uniref:Uncharacterized protein n=1 Tax=Smallanthus sonchifolius TaxID=185202 RepID=A0ACB9G4C9_9ASTR|nr:hypothetical protein L1987_47749 [Smallanthus sonchifolius]
MTKLLLLHFVMVLDLFLLRMVNWFWDFSRVNWVERAWLERLCGLKVLFLILLFPMPIFYLNVGGYSSFWAGLERVRRTPYYSIPSVESSKCEVGPNNCFYGVGYGMGWNRFAFGLLDITYYWTQVCCCWWTEKGDKKSGLNQDNIVSRSPHFYLGLVSQEPTSGRSFWPNNLARVDSDSHRGSRSWDFNLGAAIDVPRPDPHDVMPSWMSSDFWRLMVLDLILSMVPESAPTRDEASEGGDKAIPPHLANSSAKANSPLLATEGINQDDPGISPACNSLEKEGMRVSGEGCNLELTNPKGGLVGGENAMAEINRESGKEMDFAYDWM